MKIIVVESPGSVDSLKFKDLDIRAPKKGELIISHKAIGINYFDIKQRRGDMPGINYPIIPGIEASGIVEAIGPDTEDFNIGDRVAYATISFGAYAQKRVINSKYVVSLPDEIDFATGATLSKGLIGHMLTRRTYYVRPNHYILITNPISDIGQILFQLINKIGAKPIGLVDNEYDYEYATDIGYKFIIDKNRDSLNDKITEYTKGGMLSVVYDSLGDLDLFSFLGRYGLFVSFDRFSKPIDMNDLYKKGLFATSPNLFLYKENRFELILSANEYFEDIKLNKLKINISNKYSFDQLREAHIDMESGNIKGCAVILL